MRISDWSSDVCSADLASIVPVPLILLPLIRELRTLGRLRRRMETERLARSLVHLCSLQALLFTEESDERIVDETMSLIFDGALVGPSAIGGASVRERECQNVWIAVEPVTLKKH